MMFMFTSCVFATTVVVALCYVIAELITTKDVVCILGGIFLFLELLVIIHSEDALETALHYLTFLP